MKMNAKQIFVNIVETFEFADMVDGMAIEANAVSLFDFSPEQHQPSDKNAAAVSFATAHDLYAMEWGYFVAIGDEFENALRENDIDYAVGNDPTAACWWADVTYSRS